MTPSLVVTAVMFVIAGLLHFVMPRFYLAIMPSYLPRPLLLVYLSGLFEALGGLGLLLPGTRPANIEMLRLAQVRGASPALLATLWLRLPLQLLLIWWVWRVAHA